MLWLIERQASRCTHEVGKSKGRGRAILTGIFCLITKKFEKIIRSKNLLRLPIAFGSGLAIALPVIVLLAVLGVAPRVYPLMQPDSFGYVHFDPSRSAIYPVFLQSIEAAGLSLKQATLVQSALYIVSFVVLLLVLHRHVLSAVATALYGILTAANIFLVQSQVTILTEALTLPLTNVLIIALVLAARKPSNLLTWLAIGLLCGLGMATRPAFLALIVGVVLTLPFFVRLRSLGLLAVLSALFVGFFGALLIERSLYFDQHAERKSLAGIVLFGKASILTTDPQYNDTYDDGPFDTLETAIQEEFADVTKWRQAEENPFRRVTHLADLEVYGQFQLLTETLGELASSRGVLVTEVMADYGQGVLLNNPRAYLNISATHLLGLWTTQALVALNAFGIETATPLPAILPPIDPETDASRPGKLMSMVVFPGFLVMGALCFLLTLSMLYRWIRVITNGGAAVIAPTERITAAMVSLGQAHLVLIAFVNISTPRYLLSSYPFLLLALLIVADWLVRCRVRRLPVVA